MSGKDDAEKNDNNRTALQIAAMEGHVDVLRCLVEEGADKDKITNKGLTALMYAAANG